MSDKKTKMIFTRVPETLADDFQEAVKKFGFTGSGFLRAVAEGLIEQVKNGEDLALPVRVLTVDAKRARQKKAGG